ncbi:MAG: hypothetical protein V7K14_03750 [Nostoc sp.]|uniref:hypothetical protein n=1 Tax=Nostoc sp. TaxID=1180 RepID=UPI002FFBE182
MDKNFLNSLPENFERFSSTVTEIRQEDWHGGYQTLCVCRGDAGYTFEVWRWTGDYDWQEFFSTLWYKSGLNHQQIYRVIGCAAKCLQRESDFTKVNRH